MRKTFLIGTGLAIALATAAIGAASRVEAQGPGGYGYGPGMMGPGYGPGYGRGYMMAPGDGSGYMMGQGYGPGMMYGPGYGPGTMGPGMMYGYGYGPGMMNGPGYGRGTGSGWYGRQSDLNLSTDDVKKNFERWIAAEGNPHLKVGDVKEKDKDTIVADIVTKDNSLVQRFEVNRHTGFYQPSEG